MNRNTTQYSVLTRFQDISPYVESVIAAADQNKNALGFYAARVFREFAKSEQLYVAVEKNGNKTAYVGHLLFSCRYPKSSILQLYVESACRGNGMATALLENLKGYLIKHGFISISARVAEDLAEANAFWEAQAFYVQRVEKGGAARGRTINVRSHELASPQLFSSSGITSENPLGLEVATSIETPLFLLDLNVLFDLGPRRMRHEDTLDLFRAERLGIFRFAISEELQNELRRTETAERTDPMQMYAMTLPAFSYLKTDEWKSTFGELAAQIFPTKKLSDLSENDKSDIRHLETVVQHRLAGFITNDSAILDASATVKDKFGIQVLSPATFKQTNSDAVNEGSFDTPSSDMLSLRKVLEADESAVQVLLRKLNITGSAIASIWAIGDTGRRVASRYGIWRCHELLGYLTWPAWNSDSAIAAHIAVDESSVQSLNAARALLSHLLEHVASVGPVQIRIKFPQHQVYVREVAACFGFSGTSNQAELCKLVFGRIVTTNNWQNSKELLASVGRIKLPDLPPIFRNIDQQIQLGAANGNRCYVSLDALESLLAPALFCLPGRGAVITPVQRDFSEHLLGHLPQKNLLPQSKVALFQEKHYLSSPRTLKRFTRGELILFYESLKRRGLGAIVAIARVRQAYLKLQEDLHSADLDPSVLDQGNLKAIGDSKMKTVTVFDNVIHLSHPVELKTLKRIGCGRPTDLLTTNPITDEQIQIILAEGMSHD